ncbi:hypothetical protein D3C85_806250 [compost metagenome]
MNKGHALVTTEPLTVLYAVELEDLRKMSEEFIKAKTGIEVTFVAAVDTIKEDDSIAGRFDLMNTQHYTDDQIQILSAAGITDDQPYENFSNMVLWLYASRDFYVEEDTAFITVNWDTWSHVKARAGKTIG